MNQNQEKIQVFKQVDVTIIIPVYNEEQAINQVIDDVENAMKNSSFNYEILVVDDASTDRTHEIVYSKNVRIIQRGVNGGSGAARKTGILNAQGGIVVMLDGDGSYNAADIPRMLSYFPEYDQVNGARTSEEGTLKFLRMPVKWCIRKLASYLACTKIPDLNTGLKAFKKEIMVKYLWAIPNGFSCVTSMTLAFLTNGHSVKYIPSQYHKRIGKSKFNPLKDTLKYIQTVIKIIIYFNPLKIFMPISILLFLIALVIPIAYFSNLTDKFLDTTFIVLCATSLQTLFFGLIAEIIIHNK